jgi:hypothetical protein
MNIRWTTWTMMLAAALGLALPALSFAAEGQQVEATVPFSFTAGHETFPAGHYVFSVDDPMAPSELSIQGQNGSKVEVLLTAAESNVADSGRSKLVFDQYGAEHFLAKVVVAGFDEARVLPRSEIQREYAKLLEQREVPATAVPAHH